MVGDLIAAGICSVWQTIVTALDMVLSSTYAILTAVALHYVEHNTFAAFCGAVLLLALSHRYHNQNPSIVVAVGDEGIRQAQHSGDYCYYHPLPRDPVSTAPSAVTTSVPPLSRSFASSTLLLMQAMSLIVQAFSGLAHAVMESSKHFLRARWSLVATSLWMDSVQDWVYGESNPLFDFLVSLAFGALMVSILSAIYHKASRHI